MTSASGVIDAAAVAQLVLRERQNRDRGWWDDMADCFTADAIIEMSWFTGSAQDFIARTRQRMTGEVWGRHRLSPPAVRVVGDRALAELPLSVEFRLDVDGVEADLVSHCRSQYRAERRNGTWKIVRITSIYERDTLTAVLPNTPLPIDPQTLVAYRRPYRFLAWFFDRQGTPLADDLLGDDQPEATRRQYASAAAWVAATSQGRP